MRSDIYIFLGPSLPLDEAKKILPKANYLQPIRCGDIIRVLRLNPSIIGIIDGYFENTAAVWHKEILLAISQGVKVIGGSSMGALRASELNLYGMECVGEIANKFAKNEYIGDDEVCLLHSEKEYLPMTDSLVNIRATLEETISSEKLKNEIICRAKILSYKERYSLQLLDKSCFSIEHHQELERLSCRIKAHGIVDQKKKDAIAVIKKISNMKPSEFRGQSINLNKTIFFRALQQNVMCRPFSQYYSWLPIQEKVALTSRVLISEYKLIRRLSYLLSVCHGIAVQKINHEDVVREGLNSASKFWFYDDVNAENWLHNYDQNAANRKSLLDKFKLINKLFFDERSSDFYNDKISKYLLILIKLSSDYYKYKSDANTVEKTLSLFKRASPQRYHLFKCMAACWWFLERKFQNLRLHPTEDTFKEHLDQLRYTKGLYTKELTHQWMVENDLDDSSLCYMIEASSRLSHIILQNNTDILGVSNEDNSTWWFLEALYISGYYINSKDLLLKKLDTERLKKHILAKSKSFDKYANDFDFIGGEKDFNFFLECLISS